MNKPFTHRSTSFYCLKYKDPKWYETLTREHGNTEIVYVPDILYKYDYYYFYIESEDKLYRAPAFKVVDTRREYNGKSHIPKAICEEIPITDEWRKAIEPYKEVYNGRSEGECR